MKGKNYAIRVCLLFLFMVICMLSQKVQASTNYGTYSMAVGATQQFSTSGAIPSGVTIVSASWVLSGNCGYISYENDYGCVVKATEIGTARLSYRVTYQTSYVIYDPISHTNRTQVVRDSFSYIWTITIGEPLTVTFDAAGGNVSPAAKDLVGGGDAVYGELPTPKRDGYYFEGWYTADGYYISSDSKVKILTDHTLRAEWTKCNSYTIQFDGNGSTGGNVSSMNCTYGNVYQLPYNLYRKEGHGFSGWNTKSDGTGIPYKENARIRNLTPIEGGVVTLYAMWSDDDIASGTCGENLDWVIDAEGCLTISGSGSMPTGGNVLSDNSSFFVWNKYSDKIKKVIVKEGVTNIAEYAFCRSFSSTNDSIKEVQFPDTLTSIDASAFKGCQGIESVRIPDSVRTIGEFAFYNCTRLSSVELGTGVSAIGDSAFQLSVLTDIHLPASVQTVGTGALQCDGLQQITVDADNTSYAAKDGVLYDKSMTQLIVYPAGREGDVYVVPDGITSLSGSVCASGKYATLIVPATVTSIGTDCFSENTTLEKIYFRGKPPALEMKEAILGDGMESHAFNGVNCRIYYPDKESGAWSASVKDSYKNAYSFTKPTLSWMEYTLNNSISGCVVTVDDSETLAYDGTEKRPIVRVSDSGVPLIEGKEYQVMYGNNTDAGAAYVEVSGLGDYADTGSKMAGFTIRKGPQMPEITLSARELKIGGQAVVETAIGYGSFSYTSSDEEILTVDADGVVTGVKEGTAKVVATAEGDDNHNSGSAEIFVTVLHEHSFNGQGICEKCGVISIDKYAGIEITAQNATYSGAEQTASVKVTYQGRELAAGTDYEINRVTATDAGSYGVTVTGKGSYADAKTVTWEIMQKELIPSVTGSVSKTYDGTTGVPEDHALAVSLAGIVQDDRVAAVAEFAYGDKNAGTGKPVTASHITLEGEDKDNYCLSAVAVSASVGTIVKSTTSIAWKGYAPDRTYTGEALGNPTGEQLMIVGAAYEDVEFVWYRDSVALENRLAEPPKDAGTYLLAALIPETTNTIHSSVMSQAITITKADPEYTLPSNLTAVCGSRLSTVSLEGTGFKWEDGTMELKADSASGTVGAVECRAAYTPSDTRNYNTLAGISLTVMVAHDLSVTSIGEGRHISCCKKCTFRGGSAACFGGTATCTAKAVCSVCHAEYGEVNGANHDYGSWQQCDGKRHKRVCVNDSRHLDYANHQFGQWVVVRPATEQVAGVKSRTCRICRYAETGVIEKLSHQPAFPLKVTDAYYAIADSAKKQVKYAGPADKNAKQASIPAQVMVGGITYTVTEIADNAFKNNKKLTRVTIGKNVSTIGANAFSGCSRLKTLSMGGGITTIGDKAFYKCTALNKVSIPAKVGKIGRQAFYGCKKLKAITIKTSRLTSKKVGSKAFKGVHTKVSIKVPKKKLTSYRKILKAKGVGSKARVK